MSIIKQLKENKIAFGLMTQEMQDKAREIGVDNFERMWFGGFTWRESDGFDPDYTYRLKPDYTEEPEEIEIDTLATFFCPHCLKKINATFKKEVK